MKTRDPSTGIEGERRKGSLAVRMIVMLALTLLVFGGIFFMKYMGAKGMNAYFDNMPVPAATITTGQAQAMKWEMKLDAPGSFVAVNGTNVTTEAAGIVRSIHFESGSYVPAGTVLATLDASTEQAEMQRLEAQAELARLNRDRREKLVGSGTISKADYDSAVAEAAATEGAVATQRARIAQKTLRAPFAGMLGIRQINLGQYLAPGTAIVTLQSMDPVDLDFSLPESVMSAMRPGLDVEVSVDAYPGASFRGAVLATESRVDPATRNFRVRARLPNPQRKLRPGMFGRVILDLKGSIDVVAVPRTAINYSSYGTSVFLLQKKAAPAAGMPAAAAKEAKPEEKAGKGAPQGPPPTDLEVVQRFVKLGEARGDFVAITEGLKPGDEIATSGLLKLRNGQPVIVNNSVRPDVQLAPKPAEG
ncbi:MAG TPA: efflux RND transporter periplasmic adaptor subunit [Candidatus Binatia bacterium]|nr:efflux RND transporter periplasmic adaptor subunit [Candidatus Binatia bacterium]